MVKKVPLQTLQKYDVYKILNSSKNAGGLLLVGYRRDIRGWGFLGF